ncbi:MAG: hypothetical protein AAFV53_20355, partial [Myxococcota bacterium]
GLPRGSALGPAGMENLRALFDAMDASDVDRLDQAFEVRFDIEMDVEGTASWDKASIGRAWGILAQLPPGAVADNHELDALIHDTAGSGSGYYTPSGDKAVMGFNEANLNQTGSYGGPLHGNVITFDAVLRHEIGHAVDARIGAGKPGGYAFVAPNAGRWVQYEDAEAFVDAIITAAGGDSSLSADAAEQDAYKRALHKAVDDESTFSVALQALKDQIFFSVDDAIPDPGDSGGAISALFNTNRWASGTSPWYNNAWRSVGGRNFHRAYNRNSYYSFEIAARNANRVSDYQWRAPGEWFAEAYTAYYGDHDTGAAPGTTLATVDPITKAWFDQNVDQNYSIAQQTGQTREAAGTASSVATGP